MYDERSLQAVAAALEDDWLSFATDKELNLITEHDNRPDLLKPEEDGGLRILLAFDPHLDGPARKDGSRHVLELVPPDRKEEALKNAVEEVYVRTRLRALLRLPAADCGALMLRKAFE